MNLFLAKIEMHWTTATKAVAGSATFRTVFYGVKHLFANYSKAKHSAAESIGSTYVDWLSGYSKNTPQEQYRSLASSLSR